MKFTKLIPFLAFICSTSLAQMTFVSTPLPNENNIANLQPIQLDFDTDIDIISVHNNSTNANEVYDDNIVIFGNQSGQLEGTFTQGADISIVNFTPANAYKAGEKISVIVSSNVLGTGGEAAIASSFSFIAASGPFEGSFKEYPSSVLGIGWGTVDWGDYDNDGDLDLATVGWDPSYNYVAVIYNNTGGVLTDIGAPLEGVANSSCDWGDYDGDGDLDLLIAGLDAGGTRITKLYQNNAGVFTDTGEIFQGVDYSSVTWGDYDNDGDLDFAVMGRYFIGFSEFAASIIYQNNGGTFTNSGAALTGLNNGSANWVDYDGDGDLDLFLTGFDANWINRFAILYENNAGVFTEVATGLPGVGFSSADWGDYDNDGDLDLVMMGGQTTPNDGVYIYQNNAGVFTDIGAGLSTAFEDGSARWGDFDGDGDLDLLLVGQDFDLVNDYTAWVYRNDAGAFTDIGASLVGVAGLAKGEWGDFDGDGDLDFLVIGEDNKDNLNSARIYENTVFNAFITTWKTDNISSGTSNANQITIPTNSGETYNYDISWEEVGNPTNNGTEPPGQTGDYTITFPTPGTYQVEITGAFPRIYFNAASFNPDKDSEKLLTVEQWGDVVWTSMQAAFSGCINLTINAVDSPDLSGVTSMAYMFYEATSMNSDLNSWDVSNVDDMEGLFQDAASFNQPLNNWNVSNVTNMRRMFFFTPLFNQDLSTWDVSNVLNMSSMFGGATSFNQPIGNWDVSSVTTMNQMFSVATNFNQNIGSWNVASVTDMISMFSGATVFNQDISGWTVNATNFTNLFRNAEAFNQDISGWDVSAVVDMEAMFQGALAFNQDLSAWNLQVSNVTSMRSMFGGTNYNQDISGWDVSSVTDFNGMFAGNATFNQNIGSWNVTSARDVRNMFSNAAAFNQNLGNWNVINVDQAANMLNSSGLSVENYDLLLTGWNSLATLQSGVNFGARDLFYCASAADRAGLIARGWFITDEGPGCITVFEGPDITGQEILDGQPTPVNLGSGVFSVGKSVQFTIQNELASDITTLVISSSGTAFNIGQPATIITTGSTLTFDIVLTTSAAVGSYSETVSIVSDNFTTPFVFNITAEVTATPEPEIEIYAGLTTADPLIPDGDLTGLDMGSELRGTNLVDVITISNIGSAPLNITDLTIPDPAFSLDLTAPLTVAVGATQILSITLDGTVGADYITTLSITSDDTDETVYDFPVSGTILGPDINVYDGPDRFFPEIFDGQATPVSIGASSEGSDLSYQLTVLNFNPVDLDISSISITGTAFMLNPTNPIILAAEVDGIYDSFVLNITLNGSTLGVFTETISIASDDDDEPIFDFQVTGSIVAPPHIYWTENIGDAFNDDEIHRTDLDGNDFSRYYSGFADEISGIVIDTLGNRLYWTDAAQAEIITGEIGAGGLSTGPNVLVDYNPSTAGGLYDLALDLANGHIYFTYANAETGFTNKIVRVNLDGTNPIELIDLGFEEPFGIDLDLANSKIYYTTNILGSGHDARLYRANFDGTNQEELEYLPSATLTPVFFRDVKIDAINSIVYWATGEADMPGTIFYNSTSEAAPFAAPSSFTITGEIRGLDLDPINNKLYWMCRGASNGTVAAAVMRSNLDGTVKESVFTVTLYPTNYPTDPAGSAFIALDLRGLASCPFPPIADAGLDQTVCETSLVTLAGSIGGGASTLTWTTSGDGSFDDITSATAQYTPGANDISVGTVTLTITTDDPDGTGPCVAVSNDLIVSIDAQPTVTAGADIAICSANPVALAGIAGGVATGGTWASGGDGFFDIATALITNYNPGPNDVTNGTVTLTLTTTGNGNCLAVSDNLVLTISPPIANAGADQAICSGGLATLNGSIGGAASTLTWSTAGDGSFDDNTVGTAIYTPGANDITNGSVTLTITSDDPDGPGLCLPASDDLIITIGPQPTVSVDSDFTICEGDAPSVNAIIGGSASTITWTTGGDGTFDNATNTTAIYSPGTTDITAGSVSLTATTDGAGSCIAATAILSITIDATPTVNAGADRLVCANDIVVLSGIIGGSAITATWTTSGDGSFDNSTSLTANYTPGTTDIAAGTIDLTLSTDATAVCPTVSDFVTITFTQPISVVDQNTSQNIGETNVIDPALGGSFNVGDILTTTIISAPTKGTAVVNTNGAISYTSSDGNSGTDSFEFEVCNQCGLCSSAFATITLINEPPVVSIPPASGQPGGVVTIDVLAGTNDINGNIDLSSLKVIVQPLSGANAFFDSNGNLIVDYSGIDFVGTDQLTIEVCDFDGLCTSYIIMIEIAVPKVIVYNAVSPNGDGKHDYLELENVEFFPANTVVILNRWGDIVFEIDGYNNSSNVFEGNSNRGGNSELPSGTYYYKIDLKDGSGLINGFFTLRK